MSKTRRKKEFPRTDKTKGLYRKYHVTRADGSSNPGRKHEQCEYFVIDITHDPFALGALLTYAKDCESEYPILATDLRERVRKKMIENENKPLKDSTGE